MNLLNGKTGVCIAALCGVACFALFLSSCQLQEANIITSSHPQPFLELQNKTVIHTHQVEWSYQGFQKGFMVNDHFYPADTVAFYCDGRNTFANVHKKNFAELVAEGRVNVYKTQHFHSIAPKKSGYSAGPHLRYNSILDQYYIQDKQVPYRAPLYPISYDNLKPMIPEDEDAHDDLVYFRRQRNRTTVFGAIGIAAAIGGLELKKVKSKANLSGIGTGMEAGGAAMAAICIGIKIPYRVKLYKIARFYDGF